MEQGEERIDDNNDQYEIPYVERHALGTFGRGLYKFVGKVRQCETVLMECHPEENDYGEHKNECHHARLGLLRRELLLFLEIGGCRLLLVAFHVAEGRSEAVVDGDAQDERGTCHGKGKVIRVGVADAETCLRPFHDFHGCRRSKEGADVDGHVENGKCRVALVLQLRRIVEIAHHHLQVTLEQARAETDKQQGGNHAYHGNNVSANWYGNTQT